MATKRSAESSRHEKRIRRSEEDIRAYAKSSRAKATAARVRQTSDQAIEYSEIPEFSPEELRVFRPVKRPITVRLDMDLVAWLKAKGGRYQTHLNRELRKAMLAERTSLKRRRSLR